MKEQAFVIGDVHGMYDMLEALLKHWNPDEEELIFVGDLIDRGPKIREVLECVWSLQKQFGAQVIMGNHEAILLDFLRHPYQGWGLYQINGGATTLASLNYLDVEQIADYSLTELVTLTKQLYPELLRWLETRPLYLEYGEWIIAHAGVDLQIPDWHQTKPEDFYWIRDPFHFSDNQTGKKIIFGHTPVARLNPMPGDLSIWHHQNKFGIDGGAVNGGDLIGLHITIQGDIIREDRINRTK